MQPIRIAYSPRPQYKNKKFFHREEVQDYLHEIYFLPDHPELKDIHTALQDYKKVCEATLMM